MFEVVSLGKHVPQFTAVMLCRNDGQPSCSTVLQLNVISAGPILSMLIFLGGRNVSADICIYTIII